MSDNYLQIREKYESLQSRITAIENELAEYTDEKLELKARGSVQAIKDEIKAFLQQASGILLKVSQLSRNMLRVSGGRIVYAGRVNPSPFTPQTVQDVLDNQKMVITGCLKSMSMSGVSGMLLDRLGNALHTLYAIFDQSATFVKYFATVEKQKVAGKIPALKAELKELKVELKASQKDVQKWKALMQTEIERFNFQNLSMSNDLDKPTCLPIGLVEHNGDNVVQYWSPTTDGVLTLLNKSGSIDSTIDFIKGLMMQFLYSYPDLDKQLLYISEYDNDDMNVFLANLEKNVSKDLLFRSGEQDEFGDRDFAYKVGELLSALRKKARERSNLLSGEGVRNIFEYNAQNPKSIQQPILVILQNYPHGYENCSNLKYLFETSKKVGIFYVVIQSGTTLKANSWSEETLLDPKEYSKIVCELTEYDEFAIDGIDGEMLSLSGNGSLVKSLMQPLEEIKKKSSKALTYEEIGFGSCTAEGNQVGDIISIPVGLIDNKVYSLEFAAAGNEDDKPIAYLLIGAPKMGKSSLIDSMIYNGSMKYSPDDLQFYLIDFKDGVSTEKYMMDKQPVPHVKLIAGSSKQEEAEIILNTLLEEKERRNNLFKKSGCEHIAAYNATHQPHLPRIIIVIDEVQKLFKEETNGDRGRADRLAAAAEALVREGRSAGLHLFFASQDAQRSMMNSVGKFIPGRFCYSVARSDAENILNSKDADVVVNEITKPGLALVSHNRGATCRKVRIAYHQSKTEGYAQAIRQKWCHYPVNVAVVGITEPLKVLAARNEHTLFDENVCHVPIGENYYDHNVVRLAFDEMHRSLLLTGESESIQAHLLTSVMIGALRMDAKVYLLDQSRDSLLADTFGGHPNVKLFGSKKYLETLAEINDEFKKRQGNRRRRFKPIFVILHCLPTVDDFINNTRYQAKPPMPAPLASRNQAAGNPAPQEGASPMPDFYQSGLSGILSSNNAASISGADTLYGIIKALNQANDFYMCMTVDKTSSVKGRSAILEDCDYKVFHAPFVESMADLARNVYKNNIAASCNENLALLSIKQQNFVKLRYLQYDNDEATFEYIKSLGGE